MRIKKQDFTDDTVELDGNTFEGCTFTRCKLVFRARQSVNFLTCEFNDVTWHMADAAGLALSFLSAMSEGLGEAAGRLMLINTFPTLKQWIRPELLPKGSE